MNTNHTYDTLTEATQDLKVRGFNQEFAVDDTIRINATNSADRSYSSEEVTVMEFHRFEGDSDPNDMTIIYAIETPDNTRGILIDAFGTYSDVRVDQFVKGLKVEYN